MPKINPRIKSIDDLLGLDAAEERPIEPTPSVSLPTKNTIITLPPQAIRAFRGHPFRLYEGDRLNDLVESIAEHGVLNPVIIRKIERDEDGFEYGSFPRGEKQGLRNELIDACRERKSRKRHEVSFADLTPQEEKQLYTVDRYFVNEDEEAFCAGGLKITAKLLAEALHSLPDEKRQAVLLYYFFDMTDVEIAELMKVPRSTVQYSRVERPHSIARRTHKHGTG